MFGGTWGVGWKRIQEIKHGRAKEAETRKGLRHGLVRREGRGVLRRAERRDERRGGGARSEPSKEKRPVHLMQVRDRSPPPQTITKHEGDLGRDLGSLHPRYGMGRDGHTRLHVAQTDNEQMSCPSDVPPFDVPVCHWGKA